MSLALIALSEDLTSNKNPQYHFWLSGLTSHPWRWANTTVMDFMSSKLLSFTFCFEFEACRLHPLAFQPSSNIVVTISPLPPSLCPPSSQGMEWNGAGKEKRSGEERDWAASYNSRVWVCCTMGNANTLKSTTGAMNHDKFQVTTFPSLKLWLKDKKSNQVHIFLHVYQLASLQVFLLAPTATAQFGITLSSLPREGKKMRFSMQQRKAERGSLNPGCKELIKHS